MNDKHPQQKNTMTTSFRLFELSKDFKPEPLLTEHDVNSRFCLFPIRDTVIYQKYTDARAAFWTPEEVSLLEDPRHWKHFLSPPEQQFLGKVLAFFAASDAIVNENICQNFSLEIKCPEARMFYTMQIAIESIHTEMYGLLIQTLIPDQEETKELFNAINKIPTVAKKADWALKYMHKSHCSFAERLVAYAIVEGLFFSGSFCAIYWIASRNLLPGLTKSNEFIAKDEGMHCEFACFLYAERLVNKLPFETVHQILQEAVEIETEFICDALPYNLEGMNKELMTIYIQFCANRIAASLNVPKLYQDAYNPFPFMNKISLRGKTNFFEQRVSDYAMATVNKVVTDYDNEDF